MNRNDERLKKEINDHIVKAHRELMEASLSLKVIGKERKRKRILLLIEKLEFEVFSPC